MTRHSSQSHYNNGQDGEEGSGIFFLNFMFILFQEGGYRGREWTQKDLDEWDQGTCCEIPKEPKKK